MVNNVQTSNDAAASLYASLNAKANAGSTATTGSDAAGTQDRFLKLLVTQMKNQDPLNPMDNAQVTSQMAQLSTVTGIDKLNATLQALSDSMVGNQSLQAASMIGHGVLVDGKEVTLTSGAGYGGVELSQAVDSARVSIYDKAGVLVRDIDLGAQAAGIVKWGWDGKDGSGKSMPDGEYTFKVNTKQGGEDVAALSLRFGMVESVTQSKQGVMLGVSGVDGIALSQVKQIL